MDIAPVKGKDIIAVFGKRERSCWGGCDCTCIFYRV